MRNVVNIDLTCARIEGPELAACRGLHPIAIIVAIFFWGTALQGIMGMILAIPLTAFLVVFWRLAREKYIQELV